MARQAGYSLILGISGDERWLEAEQLQRVATQGASGAIVYSVDGPTDMPVVFLTWIVVSPLRAGAARPEFDRPSR